MQGLDKSPECNNPDVVRTSPILGEMGLVVTPRCSESYMYIPRWSCQGLNRIRSIQQYSYLLVPASWCQHQEGCLTSVRGLYPVVPHSLSLRTESEELPGTTGYSPLRLNSLLLFRLNLIDKVRCWLAPFWRQDYEGYPSGYAQAKVVHYSTVLNFQG